MDDLTKIKYIKIITYSLIALFFIFAYISSYDIEKGVKTEIKTLNFEEIECYPYLKYSGARPCDCVFLEKDTNEEFKFARINPDFMCTQVKGERNITYTYRKNIFGTIRNRIESFNIYQR
jgi:hypothetical protein